LLVGDCHRKALLALSGSLPDLAFSGEF